MYELIKKERMIAMKEKRDVEKAFYSTFLGEIDTFCKKNGKEPSDSIVSDIAIKMSKNILSNIENCKKLGREYDNELIEYSIIEKFLPKMISKDELKVIISDIISSGNNNFGSIIGMLKKEYDKSVDMKDASLIIKELLK